MAATTFNFQPLVVATTELPSLPRSERRKDAAKERKKIAKQARKARGKKRKR